MTRRDLTVERCASCSITTQKLGSSVGVSIKAPGHAQAPSPERISRTEMWRDHRRLCYVDGKERKLGRFTLS